MNLRGRIDRLEGDPAIAASALQGPQPPQGRALVEWLRGCAAAELRGPNDANGAHEIEISRMFEGVAGAIDAALDAGDVAAAHAIASRFFGAELAPW